VPLQKRREGILVAPAVELHAQFGVDPVVPMVRARAGIRRRPGKRRVAIPRLPGASKSTEKTTAEAREIHFFGSSFSGPRHDVIHARRDTRSLNTRVRPHPGQSGLTGDGSPTPLVPHLSNRVA